MGRARTRTIRLQVFVQTPPRKAFEWITRPDRLSRWMPDTADLRLQKGGAYSFGWNGGPTHTGTVLEYVPGKHIAYSWRWPGMEDQLVTKLKLSVERVSNGSVVRLVHSGFPMEERWMDLYTGAIQGWEYFLMNLKFVVARGADLRSPHDW